MGPCTECTHCQREAKKRARIKKLWAGAKLTRNGDTYIVAQVAAGTFHLVDMEGGNRWSDPARDIDSMVALANKDGFRLVKNG